MSTSLIFLFLSATALLAFVSIKRIPEGTVYTLRRFNGHPRTLLPGTHLVLPLLDRIVHRISLSGRALNLDESLPIVGADVQLVGKIYWQVLDAERADATIDSAEDQIRSRAIQSLAALDAPLDEPTEQRNARLKANLNAGLGDRGIVVTRVQLTLR